MEDRKRKASAQADGGMSPEQKRKVPRTGPKESVHPDDGSYTNDEESQISQGQSSNVPGTSIKPVNQHAKTTSDTHDGYRDSDLEGPLKKYVLQSKLDYEDVLVIKWRLWDGLTFQAMADKYKKLVICRNCGPECEDKRHTMSQQGMTKRFKKKVEVFYAEFPETRKWGEERAHVGAARRRQVCSKAQRKREMKAENRGESESKSESDGSEEGPKMGWCVHYCYDVYQVALN
jgi:hypothetical protein